MKKETFHKKLYYRLLQVVFWVSLTFFIYLGFWAILYEDDMPFVGVISIVFFILAYWVVKRVFYYFMFGDRILPLKNKKK